MQIAIFSNIPIFPAHAGNRARILSFCKALNELGCGITFFLLESRQLRDADIDQHLSYFGADRFHIIERSRFYYFKIIFYVILDRITKRLNIKKHPHNNVDCLYSKVFNAKVRLSVSGRDFDMVIVEYVLFSRILEEIPKDTFKVIDTHDSLHNTLTAEAETKGFMRANKIIAMQDEEAELFRRNLKSQYQRVHVVGHLLDMQECMDLSLTDGVAFIGSSFIANIISLRYFIGGVLPLILKEMPHFKLFVAGNIAFDIPDHPSLVKLGRVGSISDAFKSAPILINPIRAGTGVKIKLLEAMALGVPSISTTRGVCGLSSEFLDGVVTVADDDPSAFSAQCLRLVRERDLRIALGKKAYTSAQKWNNEQHARLEALLDEARRFRRLAP
jgi:polysaccharide biosynthesis protein PslH